MVINVSDSAESKRQNENRFVSLTTYDNSKMLEQIDWR